MAKAKVIIEGVCAVIPLRLKSQRFPEKVLAEINGMTLLETSIKIAKELNFIDKIVVASGDDDTRIKDICEKNKVDFLYIDKEVSCGTERVFYVKKKYKTFKFYVTIPVDEPSINYNELNKMWTDNFTYFVDEYSITTMYSDFYNEEDLLDPKSCKILSENTILYTSRAVIPAKKNGELHPLSTYKKHIGVFIFPEKLLTHHGLKLWTETESSKLEGLEQNMFLGYDFVCIKIKHIGFGIDTQEQIELLEDRLKEN